MNISVALTAVDKQLSALLQVVKQVAQTPMVDLYCYGFDVPFRYPSLHPPERAVVDWLIEQVALAEQLVVVPDVKQLPKANHLLRATPIEEKADRVIYSYTGCPIKHQQRVIAVLSVMARQPQVLSAEQQNAIATLAEQIGYVLAVQLPPETLPAANNSTNQQPPVLAAGQSVLEQGRAAVMKLSMALQRCISFEHLNDQLIAVLPTTLPITAFELIVVQHGHVPQTVCRWPLASISRDRGSQSLAQQTEPQVASVEPLTNAMSQAEQQNAADHQATQVFDGSHWHTYPLQIKHRSIGTLRVRLSPAVSDRWLAAPDIFRDIAEQISTTIHRLQLFQKLQSENLQDPLTTLFNRRYMMSVLSKLLKRVSYGHYQVGLIMIDIDHFKQLNDTFGHDAGDQVLRVLGLFLKGHARPNDAICRYGGEEFALILPDLTWEVLERRANQLCRSVKYLSLKSRDKPLNITLSAGYAIAPLHAKTPSTLIKAADEALYEAKRTGRDRVVGAPFPKAAD